MADIVIIPSVGVGYESTKAEGAPARGAVKVTAGAAFDIGLGKAEHPVVSAVVNPYLYGTFGKAKTADQGTTPVVSDGDGAVETNPWGQAIVDESTTTDVVEAGGVPMPSEYGYNSFGGGVRGGLGFLIDGETKDGNGLVITPGGQFEIGSGLGSRVPVKGYAGLNPQGLQVAAGPVLDVAYRGIGGAVEVGATGYMMWGRQESVIDQGVDTPFDEASDTFGWGVGGRVGLNLSALGRKRGTGDVDDTEGTERTRRTGRGEKEGVSDVRLNDEELSAKGVTIDTLVNAVIVGEANETAWQCYQKMPAALAQIKGKTAVENQDIVEYLNVLLAEIAASGADNLPGNLAHGNKPLSGELGIGTKWPHKGELVEIVDGKERKVKIDLFEGHPVLNLKKDAVTGLHDKEVIDFKNMDSIVAFIALLHKIIGTSGASTTAGAEVANSFGEGERQAVKGLTGKETASFGNDGLTADITDRHKKGYVAGTGAEKELTIIVIKKIPGTAEVPATATTAKVEATPDHYAIFEQDGTTPVYASATSAAETTGGMTFANFSAVIEWLAAGDIQTSGNIDRNEFGALVAIPCEIQFDPSSPNLTAEGKKTLDDKAIAPLREFISKNKDLLKKMATTGEPVLVLDAAGHSDKKAFKDTLKHGMNLKSNGKDYVYAAGAKLTAEQNLELNWALANARGDAAADYVNPQLAAALTAEGLPANAIVLEGHDYARPADGFKRSKSDFSGPDYAFATSSRKMEITHSASAHMTETKITDASLATTPADVLANILPPVVTATAEIGKREIKATHDVFKDKDIVDVLSFYKDSDNKQSWKATSKIDKSTGAFTLTFPSNLKAGAQLTVYVKVKVGSDDKYIKVVLPPLGAAASTAVVNSGNHSG